MTLAIQTETDLFNAKGIVWIMMRYLTVNIRLSLIAACILVVVSPYSRGGVMALSGKLVYGESNAIYSLDLSTLRDRVIYKEKEDFSIFVHLTKIDNKYLLLEDYPHNLIKKLDLETGSINKVRSGYSPQYIASHQKLFFYDGLPNKAQVGLFVVSIKDPTKPAHLIHEGPFSMPMQVIQASKDDVIFSHRNKLLKYNIISNELEELPIDNCTLPKVMRSATNQLLCFDSSAQHYFLSDLNGEEIENLPNLKGSSSAAYYLSEYDVLMFSKARLQLFPPIGEVNDIWLYSFKNNKSIRLQKNATIGLGGAVWVE